MSQIMAEGKRNLPGETTRHIRNEKAEMKAERKRLLRKIRYVFSHASNGELHLIWVFAWHLVKPDMEETK